MTVKDTQAPPAYEPAEGETDQFDGFDVKADDADAEPVPSAVPQESLSFHVYKQTGMLARSKLVMDAEKKRPLYFLDIPTSTAFKGWSFTLHRGSNKMAPLVAEMNKTLLGHTITVKMVETGFTTKLVFEGKITLNGTHKHLASDGKTEYEWKHKRFGGLDWTCTDLSSEDIVANWRHTPMAKYKTGQLWISPKYHEEKELLIAAALATEEWEKWNRSGY